MMKAATIVS